ncbi:hypothetical protein UPYG_G00017790 [Umbra pygmaea]|uniref:Coiled-coil domain-containing protein 81 n=1 Tax=Umbra pygmaea TaxID=75934 RepID=A0ABD0XK70_UMBPY
MTDLMSTVSKAERNYFLTLSQLSEKDVDGIWSNVSSFVVQQMTLQKGVHITGLGTFTFSQQKLDVGNKFILIQRPIFLLSEKLAQLHGLKQVKPLSAARDVPLVQLNLTALSVDGLFDRDLVEGCIRETLLALLRAVATGRSVLFTFHGIGELSFRQRKVKMKFYHDFVTAMDGSGKLLQALLNRPGTSNSLLSGRVFSNQRPGTSNTIILPRIPSAQRSKECGEETLGLDQNQANSDLREQNECDVTPWPRSRQTLYPAKVNGISLTDDLEPKPPAETNTDRNTVSLLPPEGAVKEREVKSGVSTQDMACVNHTRAGQEVCYVCMQRAQRNIPLYLSKERLRQEQEEARLLLLNEHHRDECRLQKEQVDRLEIRENNQKVAAFNLGVSEAMKENKAARSTKFHTSCIFMDRPLTPPRLTKQRLYMQDLLGQVEQRRDRAKKTRQDQELIDCLHQVQLSQELAQQKSQQLQQKQKDISCYQKALDKQVEQQGTGLPARQPDSDGPIFGQLDGRLAEQRQLAQQIYQEQLAVTNRRRQEELLKRSTKQSSEMEMLNRTRKELINDRINHFCKLRNMRASLEDTWSRSAGLKRCRDLKEREFISSRSGLLIDQCEQYRRCYQCKRKTTNCGETNIWKESRYIPGSRLMV